MPADAPPAPAGYHLAHRFHMTRLRTIVWINVIAVVLFVVVLAAAFGGLLLYARLDSPLVRPGLPESLPVWAYILLLIGTLILHEGLHGLAMLACGARPIFGARLTRLVLYTTSQAFFSRRAYLFVTLAPLLGITLLGIPAMLLLPGGLAIWAAIMVAMNAASALGDLWMAAVIASFPPVALFRDEADGMSVFLPEGALPPPGA